MTAPLWTPQVEILAGGYWQPVTPRYSGGDGRAIQVSRGRRPDATGINPTTVSLAISNADAELTPRNPASSLYGLIGRNTPLRVSVLPNAVSGPLANASDAFAGNAVNSWGTSTNGGIWTNTGNGGVLASTNFQRTDGEVTHYVPAAAAYRFSYLDQLDVLDCTQAVTFSCPSPTGNDLEPANLMFRGTDLSTYILVRVAITTANVISLIVFEAGDSLVLGSFTTALTHSAGTPLRVKGRAVGRDIFAKIWNPAGAEPDGWMLVATHDVSYPVSGFVGVRSGRASGNTNVTNPQFTYTNYSATVDVPRAVVEIPAWPAEWDKTGRNVVVSLDGAGILRRLLQGAKPARPALTRAVLGGVVDFLPVAYWPLDDGALARSAAALAGSTTAQRPMNASATVVFAADTALPGSPRAVRVNDGTVAAYLRGQVRATSGQFVNAWTLGVWFKVNASAGTSVFHPVRVTTSGAATRYWAIITEGATNSIRVTAYSASGTATTIDTEITAIDPHDGQWHFVSLVAEQTDSNEITTTLRVDGSESLSTVETGTGYIVTAPKVLELLRPDGTAGDLEAAYVAGVGVWDGSISLDALYDAGTGYIGETAGARLERVCSEFAVPFQLIGTAADTQPMGAQPDDTLMNIIFQCANTDGGLMIEPRSFLGLAYRTRVDLQNQAVTAALDYDASHLSQVPRIVDDDYGVHNVVTAQRSSGDGQGSSFTYEVTAGPLANVPPEDGGIGTYDHQVSVNTETDVALAGIAQWEAHQGTIDLPRAPMLSVGLHRSVLRASQTLSDEVRSLDADGRAVTSGNMPTFAGDDTFAGLVVGIDERLDQFEHHIDLNCTQGEVWSNLGIWDDAGSRYDSAYSTVNSDFDAGTDTSLSVAIETGRSRWVTGSGSPQFPFNIVIAGVVLAVTAISGASSPQTFTVTQTPVSGPNKTISAGESVRLAAPVYYAR